MLDLYYSIFIGVINIITHMNFMKIRIVHTMRADWLYGVRIKTYKCPY